MQVEHTVATTFQGTADRRVDHQLESGIVLHIESHRNIHRAACGFLFTPLLLEEQLLAHQIVGRIDLFRGDERNEIGRFRIRLSRQRHIKFGIAFGGSHDVHFHTALAARDRRRTRSENPAVEQVVILRSGIEHHQLFRQHFHRIGDIGQMFQIEVDREKALVLLRIVQRHAFGNQMIVFNLDHGPGHRVGHLRKIHRRGEIAHGDLPGKVRLLTAAAQGDIDIGIAAGPLDHPLQQGIERRKFDCVEGSPGVITLLRRGVKAPDEGIEIFPLLHQNTRTVLYEIPSGPQPDRRNGEIVDRNAVHNDIGLHLAGPEHRFHRRRTVGTTVHTVAHRGGELRERRQFEIMQRQLHRILQTARRDAVEQQLLSGIDHSETIDAYPRRIRRDTVRIDIPRLFSPADVRRSQPEIDSLTCRPAPVSEFRTESDPTGNIVESIREIGD